jgi:hypothetical protein
VSYWIDAMALYRSQLPLLEEAYGPLADAVAGVVDSANLRLYGPAADALASLAAPTEASA